MMNIKWLFPWVVMSMLPGLAAAQQVYKWIDANGQVHYGGRKPDDATPVQTLDIAPSPAPNASGHDSAAEIARINALSEQMARERQATEQARQEQAMRDLEQQNQQLQNELLSQQLAQQQQANDGGDGVIVGSYYPYPYPYPSYSYPGYPSYPPPYPNYPSRPWPPCQAGPGCIRPTPLPAPSRPLVRPNSSFNPQSVGVTPPSPTVPTPSPSVPVPSPNAFR